MGDEPPHPPGLGRTRLVANPLTSCAPPAPRDPQQPLYMAEGGATAPLPGGRPAALTQSLTSADASADEAAQVPGPSFAPHPVASEAWAPAMAWEHQCTPGPRHVAGISKTAALAASTAEAARKAGSRAAAHPLPACRVRACGWGGGTSRERAR